MSLPSQRTGVLVPGWLIVVAAFCIGSMGGMFWGVSCAKCKCEVHEHEEPDRPDIGPPALMEIPRN